MNEYKPIVDNLPPLNQDLPPLNQELPPLVENFDFCEMWERVEKCLDSAVRYLNQADAIIKADLNAVLFSDPDESLANSVLTAQRRIQVFADYISLLGSDFDELFAQRTKKRFKAKKK